MRATGAVQDWGIGRLPTTLPSATALVLAAALAVVPAAAPGTGSTVADGLLFVSSFGFGAGSSVTAVGVASQDAVAKVVVSAPTGYTAKLDQAAGTRIGFVQASLSDVPGTTSSFAGGELVVEDPARYASDPKAQACAPEPYRAVWRTTFSVLGQTFELPMFVAAGTAPEASALVLSFCPVWPSPTLSAGVTAQQVSLLVENVLAGPTARGRYTWSALVSPPTSALAPDPARAFEVRAVEPVPNTFTLRARHDPKTRTVVLSGRLVAAGEPVAAARVSFASATDSFSETTFFGPVTTDAAGEFSIRRRIEVSTQFNASVDLDPRPCAGPSTAPEGCVAETVTPPPAASAIVRIRRPTDPKLALRPRDQAYARRITLRLADFPAGWEAFDAFSFFTCPRFRPRLSDLTATGEHESRIFASEEASASSRATVYVTGAQARTAFSREARLAHARCFADLLRADGFTILQLRAIPFPALGNETRAFRIVFSERELVVNVDFVSFRQGRAVVHLGFASVTQPLLIADELARRVAARARRG